MNRHKIELEIAEARLRERQEELKATEVDLRARITILEADLEIAKAELRRSRSLPLQEDLDRAKLDLDYAVKALEAAQADHERLKSLATKGVAMMSELKAKEMAVIAARADKQAADIRMKLVRDGATGQELETARLKAEQIRIDLVQAGHELPGQLRVAEGNVTGARAEVDKFLDNAVLASVDRVRIIHGHGMGVLKRAVAELLAESPQVEKFYPASPAEGGAGATIAELKE